MSSPLAVERREQLSEKYKPLKSFLDPSKEVRFFHKIKHWTLQIGDKCYELWPPSGGKKINWKKLGTDTCRPQEQPAEDWHKLRHDHGIRPELRKVGQTKLTYEEITSQC